MKNKHSGNVPPSGAKAKGQDQKDSKRFSSEAKKGGNGRKTFSADPNRRKTNKPEEERKREPKPFFEKSFRSSRSGDKEYGERPNLKHKSAAHTRPSLAPDPIKKTARIRADLFGMHAVLAAWQNPKRHVHSLYVTEATLEEFRPFLSVPHKRPAPIIVEKEEIDRAFPAGTVHQGIALCVQALDEGDLSDLLIAAETKPRSLILVLDQLTDPHNIGAILRSACAFGADGVVVQRKHTPELTGVLAKTACGAVDHLPVIHETNLSRTIERLQEKGYIVIGLDERGEKTLAEIPHHEKVALILGAEGSGMRRLVREHCDVLARLPTKPPLLSLNVSNAAAIALYALSL